MANIYKQQNPQYFSELAHLLETYNIREVARKLNATGRKRDKNPILLYRHLKIWIEDKLPQLLDPFYTLTTKIIWIMNGFTDFPICPTCGSSEKFKHKNCKSIDHPYDEFCSISCALKSGKVQQKTRKTKLEKYGSETYVNAEKAKQTIEQLKSCDPEHQQKINDKREKTCLEKYGVKNCMQAEEVKHRFRENCVEKYGVVHPSQTDTIKQKIVDVVREKYDIDYFFQTDEFKAKTCETYLEKYGKEHVSQIHEFSKKAKKKYLFDGQYFDSGPELAMYIWLRDNKYAFKYQPCQFEYEHNGAVHMYFPDFEVNGELFELKGDHFLKEDGTWQNPWDHSLDELYEAKHQCALKHDVKILHQRDYQQYVDYVEAKYGSGYLAEFRVKVNNKH